MRLTPLLLMHLPDHARPPPLPASPRSPSPVQGSRGSLLASERAPVLFRRALASACNSFSLMRGSLAAAIEARVVDALRTSGAPGAAGAPVMDLSSMLGFGKAGGDGAWKLSLGTRQRVSATLVSRLCGVFSPLLERINTLFRCVRHGTGASARTCIGLSVAAGRSLVHLTPQRAPPHVSAALLRPHPPSLTHSPLSATAAPTASARSWSSTAGS